MKNAKFARKTFFEKLHEFRKNLFFHSNLIGRESGGFAPRERPDHGKVMTKLEEANKAQREAFQTEKEMLKVRILLPFPLFFASFC